MNLQHLRNRWRALWNPPMFHGWGKHKAYFEGWYCKLVSAEADAAVAVIPGIAYEKGGESHAFIQVLDGMACKAHYHRFPTEAFLPADDRFALQLGENHFSEAGIRLNLPGLEGELSYQNLYPWPNTMGAPGVMGWYGFVPFMECYHGVVSMNHGLVGELAIDDQQFNFTGGKGYMEKDWGRSFPSSWIWMQSNHFPDEVECSLMVSVARIPWIGQHFIGFLSGFLWRGKLYRMATYTGAKLNVHFEEDTVSLQLEQGRFRLEVKGIPGAGSDLISPQIGHMTGKINESLLAIIETRFFIDNELQFSGSGHPAGLEVSERAKEELQ